MVAVSNKCFDCCFTPNSLHVQTLTLTDVRIPFLGTPLVPLKRRPDQQGNPHNRESRTLAPVRLRMRAAGLQCLRLQIAVAFPDPQTLAFPGTELSRKTRSPKLREGVETSRCVPRPLVLRWSRADVLCMETVAPLFRSPLCLEGSKGVPRNGGRNNWLDCVLLSIIYMFKPSCWPMLEPPSLGPP